MGVHKIEKELGELISEFRHVLDNIEFDVKRGCLKAQPSGDYERYESWIDELNQALNSVIEVGERISDEKNVHYFEVETKSD